MSEKNKNIVKEVNAAFAENRTEEFLNRCSDEVVWRMIGDKTTKGRDEIRKWMSQMEGAEPPKFTVDRIVAEGDSVVCWGDMSMKNKEGVEGKFAYCDIYRFDNDKIVRLDSYVVELKSEGEDQKAAGA